MGAFSPTEAARCSERCAEFGDPSCHEVVADCDPCADCSDSGILKQAADVLDAYRRDLAAEAVIVSFGSHAATVSNDIDHYTVEIVDGGVTYRASAKHPHDAASLAKLKAKDAREARARKALRKARGDAA